MTPSEIVFASAKSIDGSELSPNQIGRQIHRLNRVTVGNGRVARIIFRPEPVVQDSSCERMLLTEAAIAGPVAVSIAQREIVPGRPGTLWSYGASRCFPDRERSKPIFETLIVRYGLLGIFLGAGIEGEAATIAGGVLAHKHLVPLWGAMLAAATGSCIVDQIYFFLGRFGRRLPWVDRLASRPTFERALSFLARHPTAFILGFRFVYGMRTVSPIAIGTSRIPTAKFVVLNMLAAAVWGPLFVWIGFAFGKALDPLISRVSHDALYAVAGAGLAAAVTAVIIWLVRHRPAA
jgi:membrane protein DedA with SNARE-associated domain